MQNLSESIIDVMVEGRSKTLPRKQVETLVARRREVSEKMIKMLETKAIKRVLDSQYNDAKTTAAAKKIWENDRIGEFKKPIQEYKNDINLLDQILSLQSVHTREEIELSYANWKLLTVDRKWDLNR